MAFQVWLKPTGTFSEMVLCLEFFLPLCVVVVGWGWEVGWGMGIGSVYLRISQENILVTPGFSEVNGKEQDSFKS